MEYILLLLLFILFFHCNTLRVFHIDSVRRLFWSTPFFLNFPMESFYFLLKFFWLSLVLCRPKIPMSTKPNVEFDAYVFRDVTETRFMFIFREFLRPSHMIQFTGSHIQAISIKNSRQNVRNPFLRKS